MNHGLLIGFVVAAASWALGCQSHAAEWEGSGFRHVLRNDAIAVEFQAGLLIRMMNRHNKQILLDAAGRIPSTLAVFGSRSIDLDTCHVSQDADRERLEVLYTAPDGTQWGLRWRIEPGEGDLVLSMAAQTPVPVDQIRLVLPGCDIARHTLVWIAGYGVGHTANAPWSGSFIGDPDTDAAPARYPHPVVALFEGKNSGWLIEGRDEMIGSGTLLAKGTGHQANLGINRRYLTPTTNPRLYEVRIRAYKEHWSDAVDPYVQWLEDGAGFIPLDKLLSGQAWVAKLRSQAYIGVGDYEGIDNIAKRLDPAKTFIGRQAEFRYHGFDMGYPHVAIETEQFNILTAKYGKLALSQMPLGHPLAGYIFQRYVKIIPEGVMYSPTSVPMMNAFDNWGFMIPGADTAREESWMQIAEAMQEYDLQPDIRMSRPSAREYETHYSSGELPVIDKTADPQGIKMFGFQGRDGVTAYLELYPHKRGLVVYEPDKDPRWFGPRYHGIRRYDGPGLPVFYTFRERVSDWLIYNDHELLGLDPDQTCWFDETLKPSPDRFHFTQVPDDFAGVTNDEMRAWTQEVGDDDDYFRMTFAGHGSIEAYVPDGYEVYLDARKLDVDPVSRLATARVNATATGTRSLGYHVELMNDNTQEHQQSANNDGPSTIVAFRRIDRLLTGGWSQWRLYGSRDSLKWIKENNSPGFTMSVGTVGRFIGQIPEGKRVLLRGSYKMSLLATGRPADDLAIGNSNGENVMAVSVRMLRFCSAVTAKKQPISAGDGSRRGIRPSSLAGSRWGRVKRAIWISCAARAGAVMITRC